MGSESFTYQVTKNSLVRIFWGGRCVTTLRGPRAQKLAYQLGDASDEAVQALLQRATGNFKRGNERRG